jgi:hypothetical protein
MQEGSNTIRISSMSRMHMSVTTLYQNIMQAVCNAAVYN